MLDLGTLRISQNGGSPDNNVVNVNTGGTIRLARFYMDEKTTSKGRVNFNGGTLVASESRGDFMGIVHSNWFGGIFFTVREGGAVIDSNGFTIDAADLQRGGGRRRLQTRRGHLHPLQHQHLQRRDRGRGRLARPGG